MSLLRSRRFRKFGIDHYGVDGTAITGATRERNSPDLASPEQFAEEESLPGDALR
jgi:hypothetical protein